MPRYLPVQGTFAWRGADATVRWWQAGSTFHRFMAGHGFDLIGADDPFVWSTNLDGVPFGRPGNLDWEAAGVNLRHYLRPPLRFAMAPDIDTYVPIQDRRLIAHSHGAQVVLHAAAQGLKIKRLITLCSPVRLDARMRAVAEAAHPNIELWYHVWSGHDDWWQWLGALFDWKHNKRKHPFADVNVQLPHVGHTGLLENKLLFYHWEQDGLLDFLGS